MDGSAERPNIAKPAEFWANCWWFIVPFCIIGSLGVVAGVSDLQEQMHSLIAGTLLIGLAFLLVYQMRCVPVKLDREHIWLHDVWVPKNVQLEWAAIENLVSVPCFVFFNLKRTRPKLLCLPTFLFRQREFEQHVIELAPHGNPLRDWAELRELRRSYDHSNS